MHKTKETQIFILGNPSTQGRKPNNLSYLENKFNIQNTWRSTKEETIKNNNPKISLLLACLSLSPAHIWSILD